MYTFVTFLRHSGLVYIRPYVFALYTFVTHFVRVDFLDSSQLYALGCFPYIFLLCTFVTLKYISVYVLS